MPASALAAAVVLLAGCGGGSDDDTSSSATSTSSSSAEASDDRRSRPGHSAFCDQARRLAGDRLLPAVTGADDPATLAPALQQAAADAQAVEPPEAIADRLGGAQRRDSTSSRRPLAAVMPNDPASAAQFLRAAHQLVARLAGSAATVQTYLAQECGLTHRVGGTDQLSRRATARHSSPKWRAAAAVRGAAQPPQPPRYTPRLLSHGTGLIWLL